MKKVLLLFIACAINMALLANEKLDSIKQVQLDEITVSAVRVSSASSVAHSTLNEQKIKTDNIVKNIPALLQTLPSVVSYTEGGTPVGNTAMRIRGTDATRINVTLNGMPLNNPESQEVYWVNLPDLSNSLKSLQVQRGVGTATAGTASFGGNISMETLGARAKAYGDFSTSYGQYNTFLVTAAAGTGIQKHGLSLDARYSYVSSDGYIRNGKVDHKNLYVVASHQTDNQILKLIYINGIQHTGITWEGITPKQKAKDRRYNPAGKYKDDNGVVQYYDNETDNYYSNIFQAQYSRYISNRFTLNANLAYNNGYGYYENYKVGEDLKNLGLPDQIVGGVTYKESDLTRRKLMSNDLYFGGVNLFYNAPKIDMALGTSYTYFDGDHYGRLLWVKHNQNIKEGHQWYKNNSKKKDFNLFLKASYSPTDQLSLTGEVQGRFVDYKMSGTDDDLAALEGKNTYSFFNPKLGATYKFNDMNDVYFSFSISNREPIRTDLKESIKGEKPQPIKSERLFDYELGYRFSSPTFNFSSNLYYMDYKDQLVQTGKMNDVGYRYQENVPDSYRYGIELEALYNPVYWIGLGGNITLSQNKIKNYTAYYDVYDNPNDWKWLKQISVFHGKTDISYSPDVVASVIVKFKPIENKDFWFTFTNKYVGEMHYDNTSSEDSKIEDYFVTNFMASYSTSFKFFKKIELQFMINNLFNKKYDANAWGYRSKFADGSQDIVSTYLFPQAGTNVMGRLSITF